MIYYIYHIPGKKIGVTCDLYNRVTLQQGYSKVEYQILDLSEDIEYISAKELYLQKQYGYKVDQTPYKDLYQNIKKVKLNKMKINITEQTTTFPIPIRKLKGKLMNILGMTWKTEHGDFEITPLTIEWIMANIKPSQFDQSRCYIYNKAFAEAIFRNNLNNQNSDYPNVEYVNVFDLIREWALNKGIYEYGDCNTQYVKLMEESGELAKAILKNDEPEIIDAIGDMVVVLTNLAHMRGHKLEECVTSAYDVIKNRTGKMHNGTFVKDKL
jgi:NTP pyrophosphatase (non-canonical NTP hydrolase)